MASFFDAFVGKFSKETRTDLSDLHNVSWEHDDAVLNCRCCNQEFNLALRKHHCRGCGGIYCETCAPNNQFCPGIKEKVRLCLGCRLGETPGDPIRAAAKQMEMEDDSQNTCRPPIYSARAVELHEGSLYGEDTEDTSFQRSDRMAAHLAGYFQLTNKTDGICAVRVVYANGNPYRECGKPSYKAVLPHESLFGEFDPSGPGLHVMVLHRNLNLTPRGGTIVYDTRAPNVIPADIAPCARIENFQEVTVYSANCHGKNVILKYKGFGNVECRQGTKAKIKMGFASMLMGKKSAAAGTTDDTAAYTMDFATNVTAEDVNVIYSTASSGGGKAGR